MLKDATYVDKFRRLAGWMDEIVSAIKKDLRRDHLKADKAFLLRNFPGKVPAKLQTEDLSLVYLREITEESNEELGEYVCNRWLLQHTDLYDFFAERLKALTEQFDELELLPEEMAGPLVKDAVEAFGPVDAYLFSVLNSVVFPESSYAELERLAEGARNAEQKETSVAGDADPRHQRELARLQSRYEKKLAGMQKKYDTDVAALKKQISTLQKKLDGKGEGSGN